MVAVDIADLVSQSEKEGLTLAEVISRELSPREIKKLQAGLSAELAANYKNIEDFMSDVRVPSLDEILSIGEFAEMEPVLSEESELSDDGEPLIDLV